MAQRKVGELFAWLFLVAFFGQDVVVQGESVMVNNNFYSVLSGANVNWKKVVTRLGVG